MWREGYVNNINIFKNKGLNNTYCFDYGNTTNLKFGGDWEGSFVHYFNINFLKCPEGQFNVKGLPCAEDKITQELLSQYLYASFFIPEILVDPSYYRIGLIWLKEKWIF